MNTEKKIFWGVKGEYGPFPEQEDGWPNAGSVIRHYRRKVPMSAENLAIQYGDTIGEKITARWILKMEQQNKIPVDITRRRALVKILGIPPILLGLASLEQVIDGSSNKEKMATVPVTLKATATVDVAQYDQFAQMRWLLSYTGEDSLGEVNKNIWELEKLEYQSSGDLQKYVRKVLNSYYQLASDITRHQGNFIDAWMYANNAVRVTKLLEINDFVAASLYRRGYTSLERGIFGDNVTFGCLNSEPDRKNVKNAIIDFEQALVYARPQLKGAIWLELSRAQGILQNTSLALALLKYAEDMVGAGTILAEPVEQILLEGALNGLNEGMYLLGKASSLIILGRTSTAIEYLDDLEGLRSGKGIPRNQSRRLAYADILRAEASFQAKDYFTSVTSAITAFQTFQDINTVDKIAWVQDLHKRLTKKYGNQRETKDLGKRLEKHYSK